MLEDAATTTTPSASARGAGTAGRPESGVSAADPTTRLAALIGNTPLVAIHYRFENRTGTVFAKYEAENMTGSIKDRMALHILSRAYETGEIAAGAVIAEASSGNTGISFAAIGRALGHPVRIFMPDWMSSERSALIRCFGAEVAPISRDEGGFLGAVAAAERFAEEHPSQGVFLPRQFDNGANVAAHVHSTGPEIVRQMRTLGLVPDAFVAGVGTGGTVMGVGRVLRSIHENIRVHPLEPANSPTLRTGCRTGSHRIQGISDEFIPSIVNLRELDEVVDVWDGDAILMAQRLCSQLGLAVGVSSGANIVGAIRLQHELGPNASVVTVLADSNKKYLSTDLCHDEPAASHYITPEVTLLSFEAIR